MKRKTINFLMLIAIMLSFIFKGNLYAGTKDTVSRDTILVMDVSYSMWGRPLEVMKKSVKNFFDNCIKSDGNNRIGIVAYSRGITNCLALTEVKEESRDEFYSFVNNLQVESSTNTYKGISKSYEMLVNDSNDNAIKNIVILTDGIPNVGSQIEGQNYIDRYLSYDLTLNNRGLAKRSGAIYKFYNEKLKKNFNVYTLGFFHSLNEVEKIYGDALLKDIQNKGYYEVTDPDKLEFAFGEISDEVASNNKNCPVIIVPGVMGSRLFDSKGKQWWNPESERISGWIRGLDDNLSMNSTLYVHGNYSSNGKPINQSLLSEDKREYGALDTYKILLNSIIDEFNKNSNISSRAVYFFSYDFRQDNNVTESLLKKFIEDILKENNEFTKVDIVAHSMGGLVCSKYVKNNGMNNIRQIITLSTPYEGSPKLIKAVLTEDVVDSKLDNFGLRYLGNLNTEIKSSFPAIAELIPTDNYFNSNVGTDGKSNKFIHSYSSEEINKATGIYERKVNDRRMSLEMYNSINEKIFKTNLSTSKLFHRSILNDKEYNILKDYDNTYFAIGINQSTISGLTYKESEIKMDYESIDNYNERIKYNLPTISNVKMEIKGDGTVPYYSLVMGGALENLESSRFAKFNTSHTGIVGCVKNKDTFMELGKCPESDVIKWVLNILGKNEKYNVNSAKVENKKYTVIRIACPVDVKVESNGEVLDSSKNSFNDRTSFGSIELLGKKGDIKIVTLYDGIDFKYNVELKGTDNGFMDYEISYFDEDENEIDRKELINVPVTIGMNAYSNTNSENIIIDIDYNGDGKYEYSLKEGDYKDLANKIIASTPSNTIKYATNSNIYKSNSHQKYVDRGSKIIYSNICTPIFRQNVNYGWNISVDGNWYYINGYDMNNRPIIKKGWHNEEKEGCWYYLSKKDGKMLIGTYIIDGKEYRFRNVGNAIWNYNETKGVWEYIEGFSRGCLYEE